MEDGAFMKKLDHFMVFEKDDIAFFEGARVDLKCIENNGLDRVTAVTTSKAVPDSVINCYFPTWICQFVQPGDSFSVVNFKVNTDNGISIMSSKSQDDLLPILHAKEGWKNVAEGFAGIGGWSHGSSLLGRKPTLLIEHDVETAYACAHTWNIPVMFPSEAIKCIQQDKLPPQFVLIADINCVICQVIAGVMEVSTWLWSPPCQPWSKAGRLSGMQSPEGISFVHALMGLRLSRPLCVNIENVPGLVEHKDYQEIKQLIDRVGYQIACSSVDKVHPLLPIIRKRWLCTLLPKDFVICTGKRDLACHTAFPSEVPGIGKETSIGAAGCVQSVIQPWELENVVPSKETLELLSRYDLLPVNVRKLHHGVMTPCQVLQARTKSLRHCLPNVMAMQGSQHTLPIQHLQEKGLHAFLIDDGTNRRFSLPFEIAAAMGFTGNTTLPADFVSAWRITGNALSVPHAALQCFRAHIMLGDRSPFDCKFKGIFDLCAAFRSQQMLLDDYEIRKDGEWMHLVDWAKGITTEPSKPPKVNEHDGQSQDARAKRVHVSPTWQFEQHETSKIIQAVPMSGEDMESFALNASAPVMGGLKGDEVTPMPEKEWEDHIAEVCESNPQKILIKINHASGFWACFVWGEKDKSIGDIIKLCLPHACEDHFTNIYADGNEVRFGTIAPQVRWTRIDVEPRTIARIVQSCVQTKSIPIMLDVTWKFKDLTAYIAAETAVLFQNMSVFNELSILMCQDSFVLADPSTHFKVHITPGYLGQQLSDGNNVKNATRADEDVPETVLDIVPTDTSTKQHDESYDCKDSDLLRLAVRCPKWGSIRTAVFEAQTTVCTAIAILFPHFHPEQQPSVAWNEVEASADTQLKHLVGREGVEVFFPGNQSWPVTALTIQSVQSPSESIVELTTGSNVKGYVDIDVKGPFDFRSQRKPYPLDNTLVNVAMSFMGSYQKAITLIVTQNGRGLDPRTPITALDTTCPIHVRACALPGGAKKKAEEIHETLGQMLSERGVPEHALKERIANITAKIPNQDLKSIIRKDEKEAWEELKKQANQAKLRLISSQELKEHQKLARAAKSKGDVTKGQSAKSSKPKAVPFEPKQVVIDVSLFHAEGKKVGTCPVGNFGPDKTGLAIVTPEQAKVFLPISRLSADPLALLVLSPKAIEGIEPMQIPAKDGKGNPILTYVVLMNFGDVHIELETSLPSTTIAEIPMTILEIVIQKSKVNKWEDVQNPLNYLGLHLPEIRTGQVVSTWNLRSYNEDRQRCRHTDASYVHGFVKIPTSGVDATLGRSGMAGIFIQAKGDNKKPDPAFGIVTMHGQSLEEVLKVASKIKDTLGVVQVSNGQYAIRGRREKLVEIRKKVMPQSIVVQEGCIEPNSQWWHLRNIHMSTTCDSLTAALKGLGWNASAIRPINKSTWLVAAVDMPPATHICINNSFVAVVPVMQKVAKHSADAEEPKVVPLALQGNFSMNPDDSEMESTAPSASRMAEMKSDLESTVQAMIEQRMQACDNRINCLQQAVEDCNATWKQQHAETQHAVQAVQKQVTGVEAYINTANTNMLAQVQSMFVKMQSNLTEQLESMKENKRQKVDC